MNDAPKPLLNDSLSDNPNPSLRDQAEKSIHEMTSSSLNFLKVMSLEEVEKMVHELRVHQIELEMQNEELKSKLQEERILYLDLYDKAPIGYCTLSEEGSILQANLTAATLLGMEKNELIKQSFNSFVFKEDQDIYYLFKKSLIESDKENSCVLRMVKKEGNLFWAHLAATLVQEDNGFSEIRAVFYDMTKRKEAEKNFIESESKLQSITESAQDAIIMIDNDGKIIFWNDAAHRITGYLKEEVMGRELHRFLTPKKFYADYQKGFAHFRTTGEGAAIGKTLELSAIHKEGHGIPVEISLSAVQLDGKWCGVGIMRDITKRKETEESLKSSLQLVTLLFENSRDALMMLSPPTWKFTGANKATAILFGASSVEEFITFGPWDVSPKLQPDGRSSDEKAQQMIATAMQEGVNFFEWEHQRLNGERFLADVLLTRIDIEGETPFLQATVRDISERKEGEKKLHQSLVGTVTAMAMTVEIRDPYTAGHQKRVAALCVAIAQKLGMTANQIEGLLLAAKIHDIGKIQIPSEILSKPGVLSELEFSFIKIHPEAGYEILKEIKFSWPIADIIRQHHEKLDGSGYPHGLKGEEILMEARILTVADMVEAICNHRPYRPAFGIDIAMNIITQEKGTKLDSTVVDACVSLFKNNEFYFL